MTARRLYRFADEVVAAYRIALYVFAGLYLVLTVGSRGIG